MSTGKVDGSCEPLSVEGQQQGINKQDRKTYQMGAEGEEGERLVLEENSKGLASRRSREVHTVR